MDIQTLGLAALQTDLFLGERWMRSMGEAAEQLNLTIQLCMSLPRHALMSYTLPAITQVTGTVCTTKCTTLGELYNIRYDQLSNWVLLVGLGFTTRKD